jgi:hypothetical protein
MLGAFLLVVIGLRHGGVQLVRTGRAHALVLVVNVRRRIQRLLQPARPEERRGPPLRVQLPHFAGNLDLPLRLTSCRIRLMGNSGARSSGRAVAAFRDAAAAPSAWADRRQCCTRQGECGFAAGCTGWFPCANSISATLPPRRRLERSKPGCPTRSRRPEEFASSSLSILPFGDMLPL